jgi:hypothetical protein
MVVSTRSLTSGPSLRSCVLLVAAALAAAGCSRAPSPGEQEEVSKVEQDVPVEVRQAALALCERIGAQGTDWYWDREDSCWELTLVGLPRKAELDLGPDGSFDELELVYRLDEIDAALPEVGQTIRRKCRTESGLVIELSLRREEYLDEVPDLAAAWKLTGVVLEFQGPGGHDYELDARGMIVDHPGDDDHDLSEDVR